MQTDSHAMRDGLLCFGGAVALGLLFWVGDGILDYFFFHANLRRLLLEGPQTVGDAILFRMTLDDLLDRGFVLLASVCMGGLTFAFLQRQRRITRRVIESEREYRTLVEGMHDALIRTDLNGHVVLANRAAATLLGYDSPEELHGKPVTSFYTDPHSRSKLLQTLHEQGSLRNLELHMGRKDGSTFWALGSLTYYYDADEAIQGTQGIFHDITELKRAEQALRESDAKFRMAFESSPDAVNINRLHDGLYVDINEGFTRLTGYTREDVIGISSLDIHIWNDPSDRQRLVEALKRQGFCENLEARFRRKDGSETTALMSAQVIQLHGVPHILSITRDISKLKEFEQQILEAKEAAEAANRSKSEFLANMSHEIRTPLNGVLGMLQLMQTTPLNEEQTRYATSAIQSSDRLARLLSDILDLSRVEAGMLTVQSQPFDLHGVLHQVYELYRPIADQESLELRLDLDPNLPRALSGDSSRLQQVLTNLVGNGLKFTEQGAVTIQAWAIATNGDSEQCRIVFSVADTGVGIPEDKIDLLFTPFTQAAEGFTRSHQGAGLGLSICKRLVSLMGGAMTVQSALGEGTTFHVTLPFGVVASAEMDEVVSDQDVAGFDQPFRNFKVLLAEDDVISRLSAQKLSEKLGCAVTAVEDGAQALETLREGAFDAVLMDIQMPVLDGVDATRAIRSGDAGDANAHIPIVAMTAYAMAGDKERFLQAGMNDYLAKPVSLDSLKDALRRAANR